jgi:hypothetical protein
MRRVLAAIVIFSLLGVAGVRSSRAFDPPLNDYCFNPAANGYVLCSSIATPTATVVPPAPTKLLNIGGAQAGPNGTTQYLVTVTSQLACFSLPEPTNLYALTSPGAAVFTELAPVPGGTSGQEVSVLVDQHPNSPTAGMAQLSLEANNAALGVSGLTVKAVWPNEQVERIINLVPPATPTATATPYPGQPTATPTPIPSPTPTVTPTPAATATPSATTLSVQACVQPSIMNGHSLGGDFPTLYGMTAPGATCTASVLYLDGNAPTSFNGASQTVDGSGIVSYPWNEDSTAGGGIARVSCQLGTLSAAGCTGFLILQTGDTGLSDAQKTALLQQIQSMVSDPNQCAAFFGA